jgi:protein involved in polysaccharide export with SLBB domain
MKNIPRLFLLIFCILYVNSTETFPQFPKKELLWADSLIDDDWQLKPGDAIQIFAHPDTASFLHDIYPIDGRGNIFLPMVGKVSIMKYEKKDFIKFVQTYYEQYLLSPNVQVLHLIPISLLGGFNKPGLYYIDLNSTIWQVIQEAGGTIQDDGLRKMKWKRKKKVLKSNLFELIESSKSISELGFQSSDQLITPSPNKPGVLAKTAQILPYVAIIIQGYTVYITWLAIQRNR